MLCHGVYAHFFVKSKKLLQNRTAPLFLVEERHKTIAERSLQNAKTSWYPECGWSMLIDGCTLERQPKHHDARAKQTHRTGQDEVFEQLLQGPEVNNLLLGDPEIDTEEWLNVSFLVSRNAMYGRGVTWSSDLLQANISTRTFYMSCRSDVSWCELFCFNLNRSSCNTSCPFWRHLHWEPNQIQCICWSVATTTHWWGGQSSLRGIQIRWSGRRHVLHIWLCFVAPKMAMCLIKWLKLPSRCCSWRLEICLAFGRVSNNNIYYPYVRSVRFVRLGLEMFCKKKYQEFGQPNSVGVLSWHMRVRLPELLGKLLWSQWSAMAQALET